MNDTDRTGDFTPLRLAVASALIDSERRGWELSDPRANNGQTHYEDDADAILAMPEMAWLRQFLVDALNTDFLSAYQCELVGEVPERLLRWAGIDGDWAEQ